MRKKNWAETINLPILIINNKNDRVVDSKKINKMSTRLKNCEIENFLNTEHEIFMEKEIFRDKMWKRIDTFIDKNI